MEGLPEVDGLPDGDGLPEVDGLPDEDGLPDGDGLPDEDGPSDEMTAPSLPDSEPGPWAVSYTHLVLLYSWVSFAA